MIIGLSAILLFFLLRGLNIYGDLHPWEYMGSAERTLMSFVNVHKYPPSLLYLLITLGLVLVFWGNDGQLKGRLVNFFTVFGKLPFFYFLLHLYLIHGLAVISGLLSGKGWMLLVLPDRIVELPYMKGYGFSLTMVYLVWLSYL